MKGDSGHRTEDDTVGRWFGAGGDLAERIQALADEYYEDSIPAVGDPATREAHAVRKAYEEVALTLQAVLAGDYDPREFVLADVHAAAAQGLIEIVEPSRRSALRHTLTRLFGRRIK